MGGVGLSLVGFFLVVRSFKISKALTFTISSAESESRNFRGRVRTHS